MTRPHVLLSAALLGSVACSMITPGLKRIALWNHGSTRQRLLAHRFRLQSHQGWNGGTGQQMWPSLLVAPCGLSPSAPDEGNGLTFELIKTSFIFYN